MEDNYIKILDSFKFDEYITTKQIKTELKEADHIEATKIIKKYSIAQPYDYIRACGKSDFTDFALNKLSRITDEDSKYIISRCVNNKVIYLQTNNLLEIVDKMKWLERRGYFNNIKSSNKKIKGYFKEENQITIGKKSVGEIKILLEKADINSIAIRKYYLYDKNHLNIQAQFGALGVYFGYKSKLARNDKNKSIYGTNLNEICIATINDIELSSLRSDKSREKIDYVDIIWIKDKNIYDKIDIVSIEVEIKRDWQDAIIRLASVTDAVKSNVRIVNLIISEKEDDVSEIRAIANMDILYHLKGRLNLAHMTIQKFIEILRMRDGHIKCDILKEYFFSSLVYI